MHFDAVLFEKELRKRLPTARVIMIDDNVRRQQILERIRFYENEGHGVRYQNGDGATVNQNKVDMAAPLWKRLAELDYALGMVTDTDNQDYIFKYSELYEAGESLAFAIGE